MLYSQNQFSFFWRTVDIKDLNNILKIHQMGTCDIQLSLFLNFKEHYAAESGKSDAESL